MNKIISFGILIGTAWCTTPSYAQSTAEGRIVNMAKRGKKGDRPRLID